MQLPEQFVEVEIGKLRKGLPWVSPLARGGWDGCHPQTKQSKRERESQDQRTASQSSLVGAGVGWLSPRKFGSIPPVNRHPKFSEEVIANLYQGRNCKWFFPQQTKGRPTKQLGVGSNRLLLPPRHCSPPFVAVTLPVPLR